MEGFERDVIDRLARMEEMIRAHVEAKCDDCKLNDRFVKAEQVVKLGKWVMSIMGVLWLQDLARSALNHWKP